MPTGPQSRRWPVDTALSGSGQGAGWGVDRNLRISKLVISNECGPDAGRGQEAPVASRNLATRALFGAHGLYGEVTAE